jgi:hypothetical protein
MQLCMIFRTVYFNILLFVTVEYGFRISPIPCQNILAIICQSLISFCLVVAFQGKPYLWGVCQEKIKIKRLAPVEQILYNTTFKGDHVQEQHVLGQQNKAQDDTLDQVVHPENQCLLDANQEVGEEMLSGNGRLPLGDMGDVVSANISPADHGQPCSNPEAPSLKLCGLVVSQTPRSAQLIQEMQKEGALLFAVQQVMAEPGSLAKGQNMSAAITLSSVMSIT